jgi:UDP-N-acetylglucosamine 1-carboxyvinyltransferase
MNKEESLIIEGLAGEKRLSGTVEINGAKNAALKAMAASVLFAGLVRLDNVPDTEDIRTMSEILIRLGAKVSKVPPVIASSKGRRCIQTSKDSLGNVAVASGCGMTLEIDTSSINSTYIDPALAKSMRSSVVLTGPMLARFHKVVFPTPGGCVIGARPIDLFIDGYRKMGASVEENDFYDINVANTLSGAMIRFEKISVGATETLMMAAVLANGETILENCALEPEIVNVAEWLNACGANIKGVGTSTIIIKGTKGKLLTANKPYFAIPDRIEAGSYLFLGALCAKDLTITRCRPNHLKSIIDFLVESGVPIEVVEDDGVNGTINIVNNTKPNSSFKSFNITTSPYPGFVTDLQAPAVVYQTQVTGKSKVIETIFEGRFKYVDDLRKLGASIDILDPHRIAISGPTPFNMDMMSVRALSSEKRLANVQELSAHDIRAGFAIVMAALVGKGNFKISNVHLIDRGYERLEHKLNVLGASVERTKA